MNAVPKSSRGRAWWGRGAGLALAACLAVLASDVAWRHGRWHARLQGVRFVEYPEKISAGGAAMLVTGYLVATIDSDVDFYRLARAESAHPKVEATLCDSDKPLGAWLDPLPREVQPGARPYSYAVLVPLRAKGADLSTTSEDLCLRLRAAATHPLSWVSSAPVVVRLGGGLHEQLVAYSHRDGTVQLILDPACAPQLCEPHFPTADLRP